VSILGLAALGAALTSIVIGALQVFEVTTLDAAQMINILFILAGTVWLSGAVGGTVTVPWARKQG
jgi:hypothetical protein